VVKEIAVQKATHMSRLVGRSQAHQLAPSNLHMSDIIVRFSIFSFPHQLLESRLLFNYE